MPSQDSAVSSTMIISRFGAKMFTRISSSTRPGTASSVSMTRIIDHVHDPARPAGDRAVQRADHGGGDRDREAELQRRLAADHQAAEDVVAVAVGAERVPRAGRQGGAVELHRHLVGVVEQRPEVAERRRAATMMPTPIRACRFRSPRPQGGLAARAGAPRLLGGGGEPATSTPTAAGSSCVAIADPRVKNAVGEVGRQVPDHGRDADDRACSRAGWGSRARSPPGRTAGPCPGS